MRIEQPQGSRGSLKWIQTLVQHHPSVLDTQLRDLGALSPGASLTWLSPLHGDTFAEYRDQAFLHRIGQARLTKELGAFWPRCGPQWDALATDGEGRYFLFEAKAHAAEMKSTCTAGEDSRNKILVACNAAKQLFGSDPESDWLTGYYQYANRLAHLGFLRSHGVEAWLVFLYFTGDADMGGPTHDSDWMPHIETAHRHLGLAAHPAWVGSVFQPVTALT